MIVDRSGPRTVSVCGFALICPVLFLLRLIQNDSTSSQALFFVLLTLAGVSFTAQIVPLMAEINHPVEKKERECPGIFGEQGATAQAYALYNVAWAIGQLIGPALSGGLVETAGWPVMVTVMGCLSAAAVLLLGCTDESLLSLIRRKH
jgi:MFS family permease